MAKRRRAGGTEIDKRFRIPQLVAPDDLVHTGPMVAGGWQVSRKQLEGLELLGRPHPEPVWGHLLIDTGSTIVVIDEDIALSLGLRPTGQNEAIHGFGTGGEVPIYEATLLLHLESVSHQSGIYGFYGEVHADRGLRARHAKFDHKTADGRAVDVIGVIGRRFLRYATVIYDGLQGTCDIRLGESILNGRV